MGGPSSAFRTQTFLYELDIEKEEIIEISKEVGELVLDYEQLASENIQRLDHGSWEDSWGESFKKINTDSEAKKFAIQEFEGIGWIEDSPYDLKDLPEDPPRFESRLLEEIKKRFVPRMVGLWEDYKEYYEDED